jgi:DNA polymerase III gamma/tau subunit
MSNEQHPELYRRLRPGSLKKVVGQDEAISVLLTKMKAKKLPHAILITGPSGVGKTTIGRIISKHLDCADGDFEEVNCAGSGIDKIRDIRRGMPFKSLAGGGRVWLLDEVHMLSSDGQNALLKMLEDPPAHVYFILCTTNPGKVIDTVQNRCMHLKLKAINSKDMSNLVQSAADAVGFELREEVRDHIVDAAEGSGRQALVLLDSILGIDGDEAQLAAISNPEHKQAAFDIVKALLWEKAKWPAVAKILKGLKDSADVEGIRHLVLATASNGMLKADKNLPRYYMIVTAFRDNFYDSKFAGLTAACYEVVHPI